MHRVILSMGGLEITSWGVLLVIAFIIGIWLAERRAEKYEVPKSIIPDISLIIVIASVVGGRLFYILENLGYYAKYPGEIFKVWNGGLIFYGGVGLSILSGIIFLKKKKISIFRTMDVVAPSVALGLGFARIGCFLNGCCFGKPTNLPWGVIFPPDSPPSWVIDTPIHLHPTQLYSSLAGFCMFFILLFIEKRVNNYQKRIGAAGCLWWIFLIMYSVWRFSVDFLRYYENEAYLIGKFTHNQILSILILLFSVGMLLKNEFSKRHT